MNLSPSGDMVMSCVKYLVSGTRHSHEGGNPIVLAMRTIMLSVKGIYENKQLHLLEPVPQKKDLRFVSFRVLRGFFYGTADKRKCKGLRT